MRVQFYGTRGSLPSPMGFDDFLTISSDLYKKAYEAGVKPDEIEGYLKSQQEESPFYFGGNTTCLEVSSAKDSIVIDCGSGLQKLGVDLLSRKKNEVHIFMTHFHWDHIQGLPFFAPLYKPGFKIHFYSAREDCEDILRQQMSAPVFPVPFDVLASDIEYHIIEDGKEMEVNGFSVMPAKAHHPNECHGYKIKRDGRVMMFLTDTEVAATETAKMKYYSELLVDVDVAIADSQYSFVEYFAKRTWGHSTSSVFIDIMGALASDKKLVLFHHDPMASNSVIAVLEKQAKRYKEICCKDNNLEILSAWDGFDLEI
ncbi:MAG: MBL fold metallo-hydrolase [Planctomycetes bacterium]|nr:MBL fold metallo-hydrolase [Planctomycetota bacterium]